MWPWRGWTPSGVTASNSSFLEASPPQAGRSLQKLAYVGTYPIWGLGPTACLDSWGRGGFFNFLKILPPFVKGMEEGKSKHIRWWYLAGGGEVHCHVYLFLCFLIGGFSYCPVSGLS